MGHLATPSSLHLLLLVLGFLILSATSPVPRYVQAELSLAPNEMACSAHSPADEGYISFCHKVITCPNSCPKCQLSCKYCAMVSCPRCQGEGSICEDPKFIGGDGVMFYFHGQRDKDFCIVSDSHLHVNAHFIGKSAPGRPRDFTWVQALAFMWGPSRLYVGARRAATWNQRLDHLLVYFNGRLVELPPYVDGSTLGGGATATWRSESGGVALTRTAAANALRLEIEGVLAVGLAVVPVTRSDSRVHGYEIGEDDCFAHLEISFDKLLLSEKASGILGQTYVPGFVNPVKRGVPMPVMGGHHLYVTSSIFKPDCLVSQFNLDHHSHPMLVSNEDTPSHQLPLQSQPHTLLNDPSKNANVHCGSNRANGFGLVCRK